MSNIHFINHLKSACSRLSSPISTTLTLMGYLKPGQKLEHFLQTNKMADAQEPIFGVFQRACKFLAEAGIKYGSPDEAQKNYERFLKHTCTFQIILGTPILTNAGRRIDKSVSACSIPSLKLSSMTKEQIAATVGSYHVKGMGTGFSLDDLKDPVGMVKMLNQIAIEEVQRGKVERPVGNMGLLSIDHPKVLDFIGTKTNNPDIKEWKFNLSVNISESFFQSLEKGTPFEFSNGEKIDPKELLHALACHAHATGDPGLLFMDRINACNKLPQIGQYKAVVPCGEVSLFEGEVCQFAYINLPSFVQDECVDKHLLQDAVHTAIVMLDNAVEANIEKMPNELSKNIISSVRRIGLGVSGYAEFLQALHLPYDSTGAQTMAANIMSFINYHAKLASINLAKERGSFPAFNHPQTRKELFLSPFINNATDFVSKQDWQRLNVLFNAYCIRNLSTTILPPSGQSSIVAGVTGSIEPPFRIVPSPFVRKIITNMYKRKGISPFLEEDLYALQTSGSVQNTSLMSFVKDVFRTALEIPPEVHLKMTAIFQQHIDEGISKTVNLPESASVEKIKEIFLASHRMGLKGITIYRDKCRTLQPKELSNECILPSSIAFMAPMKCPHLL